MQVGGFVGRRCTRRRREGLAGEGPGLRLMRSERFIESPCGKPKGLNLSKPVQ